MTTIPWLTILGVLPLVGALVLLALPRDNARLIKQVALVFSLAALVFTVVMGLQFDADSTAAFQFVESYPWIPAFGISYSLGVDGIGLVLVALATTLVPVTILAGWNDVEDGRNVKGYFAMILVLETLMIGVFSATDVFLFYVLFEVMLIPIYFLIGRYGGPNRAYAATKFLIYSLVGGLLMLAALIGLYVVSAQQLGQGTFDFAALVGLDIDPTTQKILFLGFFIAFAIKAPLWPFHTWLPDAAKESTPATAVLLIGVLDKVGTFGMIRYLLPIFPSASEFYAPIIIAMAVIGIIYGALVALGQTDMKRLFAYSSMSHFGFIALGIFVFTTWSMTGSTLYMLGHGLATAAVFLPLRLIIAMLATIDVDVFWEVQFAVFMIILLGTFSRYVVVAVIASLGIVLAAAYGLRLYQKVATGPESPHVEGMRDLGGREVTSLVPVVLLTIVLGVFPAPVLNVVNPAVDRVMDSIGMTDPAPALAPAGGEQ